jgi:hypothetical protein
MLEYSLEGRHIRKANGYEVVYEPKQPPRGYWSKMKANKK